MRLFLKHIARSIKRAPLQPILICLTVMLSVALSITCFSLAEFFGKRTEHLTRAQTELGDLLITARTDSAAHLLFEEQAEVLIADKGEVLGDFSLTALLAGEGERATVTVSAVDLERADAFYSFTYLSYGNFTNQNLARALVISEDMATANHLSVGDTVTLRILDTDLSYTVQAVAKNTGLLAQSDALISISGLTQLLAARAPIIASLGDAFQPCTRLMIRVFSGVDVDAVQASLLASREFSDKAVSKTENTLQNDFLILIQITFVAVFLVLLLLLALFVIATALALLHRRRSEEYALFAAIGAAPRQITLLIYAESMIYALFGALFGALLAVPMVRGAGALYPTEHVTPQIGAFAVLFGVLIALLLMAACTAVRLHRDRVKGRRGGNAQRKKELPMRELLFGAVILAVCVLLLAVLPVACHFVTAVIAMLAIVWLVFLLAPLFLGQLACLLQKIAERRTVIRGTLWLAAKNVKNGRNLRYAGRLLTVFLSLLLPIVICQHVIISQIHVMTEELPFDFILTNASAGLQQELDENPAVAGKMHFTYILGVGMPNDTNAIAASFEGDIALCMPPSLQPSHVPEGREIMISQGLATRSGAAVGDTVPLSIGGVSYDFVVTEILRVNSNFLYFDAASVGVARDMLCVRLQEHSVEDTNSLVATLEADGAILLPPQQIFGNMPMTLHGHVALMKYMSALGIILSAIGCINVFSQQYRARSQERRILCDCGMTRRAMLAMHVAEGALIVLAALLLAALAVSGICLLLDRGVRTFGMTLFV